MANMYCMVIRNFRTFFSLMKIIVPIDVIEVSCNRHFFSNLGYVCKII